MSDKPRNTQLSDESQFALRRFAVQEADRRAESRIAELEAENAKLRAALLEQWLMNHAELCGVFLNPTGPYNHESKCEYPMPDVLAANPAQEDENG